VQGSSGDTTVRGDLTVGGSAVGARKVVLRAAVGDAWLPPTQLDSQLQASTTSHMSAAGTLKVCYATAESGGDAPSDFVQLSGSVMQSTVRFAAAPNPVRVVVSSGPHHVTVIGLNAGDQVKLQKGGCAGNLTYSTATSSSVVVVAANQSTTVLEAGADLEVGEFGVCLAASGAGSFTRVNTLAFSVIDKPGYAPGGGLAASPTAVTFQNASTGDVIVMQPTDCAFANTTRTGTSALGSTALDAALRVHTHVNMTDAATLRVCFATQESLGDSPSDFVQIGQGFVQTNFQFTI